MSHEEWLAARNKTIGGSDAGAIMGLNPYKSAYALWAEKTGKIVPEDISDKEAVRLGNDLEEYVAKRFEEKTGKKLRRDNHIIYNDEYPFAHANIDRDVVGEDAGFEAKTTSNWEYIKLLEQGKFPDVWYAQIVHYLMVTGKKRWYLGVLCFGRGFFDFVIERDDAEIKALAGVEASFWDKVITCTAPGVDGAESTLSALRTIFKDSDPGSAVDLTGISNHLLIYSGLKQQISELEKQMDSHAAAIMDYMGTAEKGAAGKFSVSWKSQTRSTFDRKSYEAANGPIPEAFFKKSSSRPFKVTVKE
jgi:putative phage-type endonuclease